MEKAQHENGGEGKPVGKLTWQAAIEEMREKVAKELREFEGNINDPDIKEYFAQRKRAINSVFDAYKQKFGDPYPENLS
jgi:deoxyadenosine/deoxycytidine kinase